MRMKIIHFSRKNSCEDSCYSATVLFEQGMVKVRRIELGAGAVIPPCRMQEDVLFIVIEGRVAFIAEGDKAVVSAPNAIFITGGATTRSMEAEEDSLVFAVLCKREAAGPGGEGAGSEL
jgi:quercetin dioxygenase-like cupin family protein